MKQRSPFHMLTTSAIASALAFSGACATEVTGDNNKSEVQYSEAELERWNTIVYGTKNEDGTREPNGVVNWLEGEFAWIRGRRDAVDTGGYRRIESEKYKFVFVHVCGLDSNTTNIEEVYDQYIEANGLASSLERQLDCVDGYLMSREVTPRLLTECPVEETFEITVAPGSTSIADSELVAMRGTIDRLESMCNQLRTALQTDATRE